MQVIASAGSVRGGDIFLANHRPWTASSPFIPHWQPSPAGSGQAELTE
jgi:hypothetical protein